VYYFIFFEPETNYLPFINWKSNAVTCHIKNSFCAEVNK